MSMFVHLYDKEYLEIIKRFFAYYILVQSVPISDTMRMRDVGRLSRREKPYFQAFFLVEDKPLSQILRTSLFINLKGIKTARDF